MSVETLLQTLQPVFETLAELDLTDAGAARAELSRRFPLDSALVREARELFDRGVEEGWLCGHEAGGARFSRVAKTGDASGGFSVDAVQLSGPGPGHRHTNGEVDLCFARDGEPRFDGQPEGWVVFGAASEHVPTVTGGTMDILYFLPGGAIEWRR
jgi:hypothetical protein